jgi:hypothetical protein
MTFSVILFSLRPILGIEEIGSRFWCKCRKRKGLPNDSDRQARLLVVDSEEQEGSALILFSHSHGLSCFLLAIRF